MKPRFLIVLALAALLVAVALWRARERGPRLLAVGPRLLSNQTSQPLSLYGERFVPGMKLVLGPPVSQRFPTVVLDERHAFARLPGGLSLADGVDVALAASIEGGEGEAPLTMVNDTAFPELTSLAVSRRGTLFAASTTTDEVLALEPASGAVERFPVGDGPSALGLWEDPKGSEWLVVVHAFAPEVRLLRAQAPREAPRIIPGPAYAAAVSVAQASSVAFVAEHARDSVLALALPEGRELWRAPVAPNPRAMAVAGQWLAVGSLQTGEVELLELRTGQPVRSLSPGPGTPIVGGGTEAYARYVMGGKAPRGLAWSPRLGRLFLSSIGPNVGPNPDRMEVSMNGGVAALELEGGRWLRHLGFGAGVTEALALDDEAGLLYASDVALGLVRVLDARGLAESDDGARAALVQELALPPPEGFPLVRPKEDFGRSGRAGPSLHSGPRALALSEDRRRLYALNRFTGTIAELDVSGAARAEARFVRQWPVVDALRQRTRRLGQVLYFADLGRTAMSCDGCHLDGHTEGVLFEKTTPLRIYRSSTVRGGRETPPYFTPASTHSLAETARLVGSRNRFQNPPLSDVEIDALALYSATLTTLPNPFVGSDGAPLSSLRLPDGSMGNPRAGLALFEGRAGCAECHPAPHFTTDQSPATRGRYLDVGTPHGLSLRAEQQDLRFMGFAPPALVGAWDIFPMLTSGAAGLEVRGEALSVSTRFPLRPAVEQYAPRHGRADLLTPGERNDLIAYVLSL